MVAAAAAKSLQSCPTLRRHRRQPIRLPHPWDSPGKNTGVVCHFLLQCMKVKSEREAAQSCPTLCDPVDCSLPGSSTHGIFQARALEWVAITFSWDPLKKGWIVSLEDIWNHYGGIPKNLSGSHQEVTCLFFWEFQYFLSITPFKYHMLYPNWKFQLKFSLSSLHLSLRALFCFSFYNGQHLMKSNSTQVSKNHQGMAGKYWIKMELTPLFLHYQLPSLASNQTWLL